LHAVELHLLAHFIKPLDQFSVSGNTEVFALLKQKLAVDKSTKHVFLALRDYFCRIGWILLLGFVFELLLLAIVIGTSNNLVVNSGDNFLYHGVGGKNGRHQNNCNNNEARKDSKHKHPKK